MTLPVGFRLHADKQLQRHESGHLLVGGSPRRVLRLTARGAEVAQRLLDGEPVTGNGDALLARRLLDTGVAHPVPIDSDITIDVVVPVYEDAAALDRCLSSLGSGVAATVVDDGSVDAAALATVAARHGARLIRQPSNGGPAAARNAGAARGTADVIAFIDSDAVADLPTLRRMAAHFSDPHVVAAAPRVAALDDRRSGVLGVIARHWSPLDLGPSAAAVVAAGRVAYVPSTVLLVRRDALAAVGGFDETLRYGEDVDLVWRLAAAGRVRYDPTVIVRHAEPVTWSGWLWRRYRYGTSAAALARRHGERAAPLVVAPAPLAAVALAVAGAPRAGVAVAAGTAWRLRRRLRAADVPAAHATRAALVAPVQTALGAARWATQLWWPALLLAGSRSRRSSATVALAVVAPPLVEWAKRRPGLDPLRWSVSVLIDDTAYGLGVWAGCLRQRTVRPLLPGVTVPRRESD